MPEPTEEYAIRFPNGRISAGYVDRKTRDYHLRIMQQTNRPGFVALDRNVDTRPWREVQPDA